MTPPHLTSQDQVSYLRKLASVLEEGAITLHIDDKTEWPWGDVIPLRASADALESATARLKDWETAFETTNPAQAKAEHLAVLAKRDALQERLREVTESFRKHELLLEQTSEQLIEVGAENARLKDDIAEARKAPGRSEEQ